MPDHFEFSIPSPSVSLDAQRTGQAMIDVTSRLDRHGRVRVEVLPGEGADAAWFVPEPVEFDLPTGETLRSTLAINVPAGVEPGDYTFEVRASAVDRPQIDFTVSPSVSVTVPPPAAPSGIPSWIFILIGAVVLVILALAAYFLFFRGGEDEAYPDADDLITKTVADARGEIDETQSLTVYSEQDDADSECILLQTPPPNTPTLNISVVSVPCPAMSPTVQAPDVLTDLCGNPDVGDFCNDITAFYGDDYADNTLWDEATISMISTWNEAFQLDGTVVESAIGMPLAEATEALESQGFSVRVTSDETGTPDCAFLQHPFPDAAVAVDATITVVSSKCPAAATSPDLVVLATPIANNFNNVCTVSPGFCNSITSSTDDDNYIFSTEFEANMNSMVSTFRNTFSGDVVPKVTGSTLNAAITALEEKGLEPIYAFPQLPPGTVYFYRRCFTVVGQNPNTGQLIDALETKTVVLQLEEFTCDDIFGQRDVVTEYLIPLDELQLIDQIQQIDQAPKLDLGN